MRLCGRHDNSPDRGTRVVIGTATAIVDRGRTVVVVVGDGADRPSSVVQGAGRRGGGRPARGSVVPVIIWSSRRGGG